ncbi:MAG: hypothetical protein KKE17_12320 [Proteobacteria bacterium]|nr:hypothetical protein [Pseudomonadota bacterium]MBU1710783.1 hypothetical protein [Pseudomonadota bacterium]
MQFSARRAVAKGLVLLISCSVLVVPQQKAAAQAEPVEQVVILRADENKFSSYSSLPDVIEKICRSAISQFYDFYAPQVVNVEPFNVIDERARKRITLLGVTLADQMTARINSDSREKNQACEQNEQWLRGVMQEVDGMLRVHISGLNGYGQRRSYVVTVEMSEAVYRALHTYVKSGWAEGGGALSLQ